MRILILAGGLGAEHDISIMSAASVKTVLENMKYDVLQIDPGQNLPAEIIAQRPDVVFNCLHGTYGEDGSIPGLLEVMQIPYTHSGVMASAVAMNKGMTRRIAQSLGIKMPEHVMIRSTDLFKMLSKKEHPMTFPYIIKPVEQGSTIGAFLVKDHNSHLPIAEDWHYGDEILIERYIPGQEISAAVFSGTALGVLELRPKSGFYDYQSKYTDGAASHIYPAEIPENAYKEALNAAEVMHNVLGCRTISRSDFRYNPEEGDNGLYFLELNTHPGFTTLSILPEIAAHNEISFEMLVMQLLNDAICEKRP